MSKKSIVYETTTTVDGVQVSVIKFSDETTKIEIDFYGGDVSLYASNGDYELDIKDLNKYINDENE